MPDTSFSGINLEATVSGKKKKKKKEKTGWLFKIVNSQIHVKLAIYNQLSIAKKKKS